jgi:hypothetical protein
MMRSAAALLCLALLACGGSSGPATAPLPVRATTAGQSLLSFAPLGADLLLEVDLSRLRQNAVVGGLLSAVAAPGSDQRVDLLQQAEVALLCVYDIGGVPKQLILLRAEDENLAGTEVLAENIFAVGDSKLVSRAAGIQSSEDSMLADRELLRIRETVMPAEAKSASLRVSVRLDFDARVQIASKLSLSDVPVSIALWGDVVDDMALVAHLASDEAEDVPRLERAILGLRGRFAKNALLRFVGLSVPIREAKVRGQAKVVKVTLLVGPKRLQYVVGRLLKYLSRPGEPPRKEVPAAVPVAKSGSTP